MAADLPLHPRAAAPRRSRTGQLVHVDQPALALRLRPDLCAGIARSPAGAAQFRFRDPPQGRRNRTAPARRRGGGARRGGAADRHSPARPGRVRAPHRSGYRLSGRDDRLRAMADFYDAITDEHRAFFARQPVCFVATAAPGARVNLSPKGMDSFRVLAPDRVAYLDLGGSGNETQAHLAADGRITIMFCAFDNPALILRLYGRGSFIVAGEAGFDEFAGQFPALPGRRKGFDIAVARVQTSCGWGVSRMSLDKERMTLAKYHAQQAPEERLARSAGRTRSIDGLPVRVQQVMPAFDPLPS